jgi:hypothetical protein
LNQFAEEEAIPRGKCSELAARRRIYLAADHCFEEQVNVALAECSQLNASAQIVPPKALDRLGHWEARSEGTKDQGGPSCSDVEEHAS